MILKRSLSTQRPVNRSGIENKAAEATVYLYSDIGGYFFDQEQWIKDFNEIDAGTIHLRVDSDGGDVFTARSMKTAIMQHKSKVIAHVDGIAASAASFLIMGADEIEIVDGGFIMIHNALSYVDIYGYFNIEDLGRIKDDLSREMGRHAKINESIAADYVKKTGNSAEDVLQWMSDETWMTATEAVEKGFADRVYDGDPVENSHDLSGYLNTPEELKDKTARLSKRTLEKALRDAGISNKDAKKIIAEGYKDDPRDVDVVEDSPPEPVVQRDVELVKPEKDRVSDLLTRAEVAAPTPD